MNENPVDFAHRIAAYGAWRERLAQAVRRYGQWLDGAGLCDGALQARLDRLLERLRDDRMSIAFIAEFSRGKSELINALFFARYGQRILPSSAGRTTMCPTELMYDPAQPPAIRLLPIESRLRDASLADLRANLSEWHTIPIQPDDADSVRGAFEAVRETKRVSVDEARQLGLADDDDADSPLRADASGLVEIPRWRHAIANIPDPLLEQGLVVIDTPGLNAIGHEPELTLNLIPSADAVLFVLAADAGVTRSDVAVWRENICPTHRAGRLVVLNKIDGLWDDLSEPGAVDAEIARQVVSVSHTLDLSPSRIFPVSAQKALVAKVQRDARLLARSRLAELERALCDELVPQQQAIVRENVRRGFDEAHAVTHELLQARRRHAVEQLFELNGLRGKNRNVVDLMATRIRNERSEFEKSLRQLQALRAVFARHSQSIYEAIAIDALKRHVRGARDLMRASNFTTGLRDGMSSLLDAAHRDLERLDGIVGEVMTLMTAMYKSFAAEHGLALGSPLLFSTRAYHDELTRIESVYKRQFGAIALVTTEKGPLMKRYFESVATRLRELYEGANRDVESWLRAVIAPIEGQVREHQGQLRRRLESVRRVLDASGSLDARIAEIDEQRNGVEQRIAVAQELADQVRRVLDEPVDTTPLEAALALDGPDAPAAGHATRDATLPA